MEYFVRTSHIVSGLIYVMSFIVLLTLLFVNQGVASSFGEMIQICLVIIFVPIIFVSSIHYIVLKKFHPWAKITEENETEKDKNEYIKVTDKWNDKIVIRNGAIFGVFYSVVRFYIDYSNYVYETQERLFLELLLGHSFGGAIGGVLLFGIVAVIRNKFIVRK